MLHEYSSLYMFAASELRNQIEPSQTTDTMLNLIDVMTLFAQGLEAQGNETVQEVIKSCCISLIQALDEQKRREFKKTA